MRTTDLNNTEYNPYYGPYIKALGDAELMKSLENGKTDLEAFIVDIPDDKLHTAYAEGKWTVAEVLLHLIDAERVFQYRALRFARNDATDLPGFDQDNYVPESGAGTRNTQSLSEEFAAVRQATISLFRSFTQDQLLRSGTANSSAMSVRALGFVVCGHQKHHERIIRERYL